MKQRIVRQSFLSSIFILFLANLVNAGLNDGLVAYYPFNANPNDQSGYGNHCSVNGATLTSDRFGSPNSAYKFDGINDFMRVPDSFSLRLSNTNFTLSAWVYEKSRDVSWADAILFKRGSGSEDGWHISISGELSATTVGVGYLLYRVSGSGDPYINSLGKISLNVWHHILMVYDNNNSTAKMYIDGKIDSTKSNIPSPNPNTSEDLFIGKDSSGDFGYYFDGLIDEVRIYNRALTEAEIVELYKWNDLDDAVTRTKRTDFNNDGDTDGSDLSIFLTSYGSHVGGLNYNLNYDLDSDGDVDLNDLIAFSGIFGNSVLPVKLVNVPVLDQNDYPFLDTTGTLGPGGCVPVSFAMLFINYFNMDNDYNLEISNDKITDVVFGIATYLDAHVYNGSTWVSTEEIYEKMDYYSIDFDVDENDNYHEQVEWEINYPAVDSMSNDEVISIICNKLALDEPVLLGGYAKIANGEGGHALLITGYLKNSENEYFRVNDTWSNSASWCKIQRNSSVIIDGTLHENLVMFKDEYNSFEYYITGMICNPRSMNVIQLPLF